MLKIGRLILAVLSVALASFILITQNFELMPYLMLILAISMMLTGIIELKKDTRAFWGYMSIFVALFVFYVSFKGFLVF